MSDTKENPVPFQGPFQKRLVEHKSVTELCADYTELGEFIAGLEGRLRLLLKAASDDLNARDRARCDNDMLSRNLRTIADTKLRQVISSFEGF